MISFASAQFLLVCSVFQNTVHNTQADFLPVIRSYDASSVDTLNLFLLNRSH